MSQQIDNPGLDYQVDHHQPIQSTVTEVAPETTPADPIARRERSSSDSAEKPKNDIPS
ncbi:hypothetical protein BGZ80_001822, partial [Entomortierella chlamydospora]